MLAANCYDCHADEQMGGLRLDSREALLKGGRSGPALVPGDPDKSLLIQAVRQTSEKLKMPKGGRLKPDEIEALAEWVRAGRVMAHLRADDDARRLRRPPAAASAAPAAACLRHHAGAARVLVVSAAAQGAGARRRRTRRGRRPTSIASCWRGSSKRG